MADDIIGKVFSLISGDGEPNSDKKILLRQVVKEINQNKYVKFYRLRTEEIDPSFAVFFYDIYKTIYPACAFGQNTAKVARLKHITTETFMDKNALEIIGKLRADIVQERIKNADPQEISKQLREDLMSLSTAFHTTRIASMNRCYNLITAFVRLTQFDFLSLLRRFDASLPEGNSGYVPRFQPAKALDLVQELGEFRAIIQHLEPTDDWKNALGVLKIAWDGKDLISLAQWNLFLTTIRDLKQSNIIELMNQYATKNPVWQVKHFVLDEQLAETWLQEKNDEVRQVISQILIRQQNNQIAVLATAVFGISGVTRLQFYNREVNNTCVSKGIESFAYAGALNYLTAFIQDFITKEIQELCDILLVRGQWINNSQSLEMSNAVHTIADLYTPILALDESLSETGTYGPRFKGALVRADRDKIQLRYANHIVDDLDETALELLNTAVQNLVIVGKHMKNLLGDIQKDLPELIINWKELGYFTKIPISSRLTEAYKKINYFVQLMLLMTRSEEV